ncbi:MAG TPA: NfeD family protein [Micavibrio sp.]|nr:NfeD family protein [Micavibrio sp.]
MAYLEMMEFWHWLVFGLLLLVVEVFVFGAVLMWFGFAALLVGLLVFFIPALIWMPSLVLWAFLSVLLAFGWHLYRKKHPPTGTPSTINRRGEQIVGRHFALLKDIVNGVGELHVDDTRWKIISHHDLPAGSKVKVVAVEGTSLRVEEYIS